MMPVPQRLDPGLDDMLGRAEIRLPDPEIDDVLAVGGQRLGARENLERGLGAKAGEGGGGVEHGGGVL